MAAVIPSATAAHKHVRTHTSEVSPSEIYTLTSRAHTHARGTRRAIYSERASERAREREREMGRRKETRGEDELRPKGLEHHTALHGHGVWHGEHEVIAFGRRHHGQADARVARRRFHQGRLARRDLPPAHTHTHTCTHAHMGSIRVVLPAAISALDTRARVGVCHGIQRGRLRDVILTPSVQRVWSRLWSPRRACSDALSPSPR